MRYVRFGFAGLFILSTAAAVFGWNTPKEPGYYCETVSRPMRGQSRSAVIYIDDNGKKTYTGERC